MLGAEWATRYHITWINNYLIVQVTNMLGRKLIAVARWQTLMGLFRRLIMIPKLTDILILLSFLMVCILELANAVVFAINKNLPCN